MDYAPEHRQKIAAMPRIRFVCGRDWYWGPDSYAIGFYWGKNLYANEGECVYSHAFVLHISFSLRLETN